MFVIGTAGHVDHGKSTLIKALTGRHPDRLAEERDREMSIVLGFDTLELPSGKELGIIDVPGHRDFIENMLSGVGGIDAALFVIAADEGVMPQTREHLAILDLLEVESGVIALTKVDLIDDSDWLDLVELDVVEACQGTVLEDAPLVRVSGTTGSGLEELLNALDEELAGRTPRPDLGRPRLAVDRAFTVAGFGTVVTGTLLDGSLKIGDEISILPGGVKGRIRGLQTHHRDVEMAQPGSRAAVNISGVDVEEIQRGDVITRPGHYSPTRRLDVQFRLLPEAGKPLEHNVNTKLFLGADEAFARVRLLGKDLLLPGETGYLQLETPEPVVAARGDHYILRQPSPSETIGGGIVLDPHPEHRHKRFDEGVISHLRALTSGNPVEIIRQIILQEGVISIKKLGIHSSLKPAEVEAALQTLIEERFVLPLGDVQRPDALAADRMYWKELIGKISEKVQKYHRDYPLRPGISREELKSQSSLPGEIFEAVLGDLIQRGEVVREGPLIKAAGHQIVFSPEQSLKKDRLLQAFEEDPYTPPIREEAVEMAGEEILHALAALGELIPVSEDVFFSRGTYQKMHAEILEQLRGGGTISVAEARDHFQSSRRYILAFLEHLDAEGVTIREGDVRRLR